LEFRVHVATGNTLVFTEDQINDLADAVDEAISDQEMDPLS
jgi:hypothetical protein